MKITNEVLEALGATKENDFTYVLRLETYILVFWKYKEDTAWKMKITNYGSIHEVDTLVDVFENVICDMYDEGIHEGKRQVRKALGL